MVVIKMLEQIQIDEITKRLYEVRKQIEKLMQEEKELRNSLKSYMKENSLNKLENRYLMATIFVQKREMLDKEKLKERLKDEFNNYVIIKEVENFKVSFKRDDKDGNL